MDRMFGGRRTKKPAASQDAGLAKPAEHVRRRSITGILIPSLNARTPAKQKSADLNPYPENAGHSDLSNHAPRGAKVETDTSACRGQADLDTEVQGLRRTIVELNTRLKYYQSEPYRNEVLSTRQHLKAEEHEPWSIVQRFTEITGRVEDIAGELSELLLSLQPLCQPTTHDLFGGLLFPQRDSNLSAQRVSRHPVRPNEYIDFGCRALINKFLMDTTFNERMFHPSLSPEENGVLYSRYQKIRLQDPQVITGNWRVSTTKSIGESHLDHTVLAQQLCQDVLMPFCGNIYNLESMPQTLDAITGELSGLLKLASEWRSFTAGSVVMYDFHPQFFEPGTEFNIRDVEIEGMKDNMPASSKVLLTARLVLMSSRALGDSKEFDRAIQSKVGVLTSEYFAVEA